MLVEITAVDREILFLDLITDLRKHDSITTESQFELVLWRRSYSY
jgi:hypothetical protein